MIFDQALPIFIEESRELLEEMEQSLLSFDHIEAGEESETVNAIFRAMHTIKGSAGLFGLDHIVRFTHVLESLLDEVREGKLTIKKDLVSLLLTCCDHVNSMITKVEEDGEIEDLALTEAGQPLLEQLKSYMLQPGQEAKHKEPSLPVQVTEQVERIEASKVDHNNWHISLRFGTEVFRNGMDPLSFIRYLGEFGTISGIITLFDDLPDSESMDPESCYLGFEIAFKSDADKAAIENVFEFVRDDCTLRILPPSSRISDYIHLLQELPADAPARLGEMLVRCGTVTEKELQAALQAQSASEYPAQPIGAILVEQGVVQPTIVEAALTKQKQAKEQKNQEQHSIRVDAQKLDRLINLISELVTSAARTQLIARQAQIADLDECASTLSGLVEEVHDSALQLRMVKIGATFNRFQRVVHDVSRDLGKDIALVIHGEDTELDKTIIEKISDPLMHLVRNAMDHGIESAETRIASGKSAQGTVTLNAYHDSGHIVIEISDDGGGLRRERILAKAISKGLVDPASHLSDTEIYDLIFEPGFSTAEAVTNLSGRGVGMDVVKQNIVALRGTVHLSSKEGIGTKVTIHLPLTLAIIDGFLVGIGKAKFVVPLEAIEECVEFSCEQGRDYTSLRGHILPIIQLKERFGISDELSSSRPSLVVVKHVDHKVGLAVDALYGEFQTVIKPLSKIFKQARGISGSTILGSGELALILDIPALISQAAHLELDKSRQPQLSYQDTN